MKLGIWNRLAIVSTVLALLIAPLAIMFSINSEISENRTVYYNRCMKLVSDVYSKQPTEALEMVEAEKKCWEFRFPDPDPAHQGWDEWSEYFFGTAQFCAVLYALIWSIVATVKWVLRGRQSSGNG